MENVIDWLREPAAHRGIHFSERGDGWTYRSYAELARQAKQIASLLSGTGVRRGDLVSLVVAEPRDFVPAFLGTLAAGAVASPIASPLTFPSSRYTEHVAQILAVARPRAVLSDAALFALTRQAATLIGGQAQVITMDGFEQLPEARPVPIPASGLQLLQFTSGSSGTPKGVKVSKANLTANVSSILTWLEVTEDDIAASWLPTYHDMGLVGTLLGSVAAQIDLWMMSPVDFVRSPLRWLELFGRRGATITASPNFGYGLVAKKVAPAELAGMDFSRWRVAGSGAERVDPKVTAVFARLLEPHGFRSTAFAPSYGMAEATLAVSGIRPGTPCRMIRHDGNLRPSEPVAVQQTEILGRHLPQTPGWLSSCGSPLPDVAVDIVDEQGRPLPEGHFGEIRVHGPGVTQGYAALSPNASSNFKPDGLHSGDGGFVLDGEVFVVGRLGESMKIRGRVVHAEDVEQLLWEVKGIGLGRCAVALGTTSDGNEALLVVESEGAQWLQGALGVIRSATDVDLHVEVVRVTRGGIPRTSSGKPRRRHMWTLFHNDEFPGEPVHRSSLAQPVPAGA
jgi:acyl-CoA synthetase (AMP-forming)/AMP-acid ligase II